ncbi:hypothetical protein ACFL2F_05190 [Myxococcota bacterium]
MDPPHRLDELDSQGLGDLLPDAFLRRGLVELENVFLDLEAEGKRTLKKSGAVEDITFERSVDVRFVGQGSETNLKVPESDFSQVAPRTIRERFDQIYEKLYGRTYPDTPVEFINFKVRARLPERLLHLQKLKKKKGHLKSAVKGKRPAYSALAGDFIPHTVYDRYKLFAGAKFKGPAIVEERESTVVVGEDASASVDEYGFLWIDLPGGG